MWSFLGPWLHDCFYLSPLSGRLRCIPKKKSEFVVESEQAIDDVAWGIEANYAIPFLLLSIYHLVPLLSSFGFWIHWLVRRPGDRQNASVPALTTIALMAVFWVPFQFTSNVRVALR
jgi:hypothetical protein